MLQSDKRILSITVDYYYYQFFFFFTSAKILPCVFWSKYLQKKNVYFGIEPRTAMFTQASKVQAVTGKTEFFFFFNSFLLE